MTINPRILKKIDETCKDNEILKSFLKEMLMLEAEENMGWWKEPYRDRIAKYVKEQEGYNENK